MTDVVVDRLRIRGGDARRLATVAARTLPGALDRALADLADVELDRLTVLLPDPADHDDATLAILWADGIRQSALAAGARLRARAPGDTAVGEQSGEVAAVHATDGGRPVRSPVDLDALATAVSAWLAAGGGTPVPAGLVGALSDPGVAAAVLRLVGPEHARPLVAALEHARVRLRLPGTGTGAARTAEPEVSPLGRADDAAPGTQRTLGDPDAPVVSDAADTVAAAARAVHALVGPVEADATAVVEQAGVTRAAGLVLTYPWLADLCRLATDLYPGAEPSHARRVALAALADPDDPALVDDPLVRFLAGAPQDATPAAFLVPLGRTDEVLAAADDVLRRFVALLPGFEGSSDGFVRASWLLRAGLLDADRDPAALVAQTAPLDVVLPLLPYPLGVLRLPWTPVLSVRFRP
ncbi:contractile injection system tape measure protein [Cellulomonas sp.]|uniref:contractile injection system tape measure protein n=1 Tax=Cellulomonas sp. TaxID=40001 RepID=UPI003BACE61A